MRRYFALAVILALIATVGGLLAGLIEEANQLQTLANVIARSDCASLRSEFSPHAFIGYHLAISMVIAAGSVFIAASVVVAAYRWIAGRIFNQFH